MSEQLRCPEPVQAWKDQNGKLHSNMEEATNANLAINRQYAWNKLLEIARYATRYNDEADRFVRTVRDNLADINKWVEVYKQNDPTKS